jgi:hypothetical protein
MMHCRATAPQLPMMPEGLQQHSPCKSKRIAKVVKRMFQPAEANPNERGTGVIFNRSFDSPLLCKIYESLEFEDLLAVAWCDTRFYLDLETRLAFISIYDAHLSKRACTQSADQLDNVEVLRDSIVSGWSAKAMHALTSPACDLGLGIQMCQINRLLTSPPACCSVFGPYWRCLRRRHPPTRLQIALFADFLKCANLTSPVHVFLSPIAGFQLDAVADGCWNRTEIQQHRQRYGLLDYQHCGSPMSLEGPHGKIYLVPPEIVSASRCCPPLHEEAVERVIFAQLKIIYGAN